MEWIRTKIIAPETRYKSISIIYSAFAIVMLLHHVYVTIYYTNIKTGADFLSGAWIFFSLLTILLGRLWKEKTFWVLCILLVLRTLRIIPAEAKAQEIQHDVFIIGIYAYFGCYGLGRTLTEKDLRLFIEAFCAIWTTAMIVFSCFGIYVAWTGLPIHNLGSKQFYIRASRLSPIYHMVEGGIIASTGVTVALTGFAITNQKILKKLYVPAIIIIMIAGALTATRTSYILCALAICWVLYLYLEKGEYHRLKSRDTAVFRGIKLLCLVALGAVLIIIQIRIIDIFNIAKTNRSILITNAVAEAIDPNGLAARGFETGKGIDEFLNGRIEIWRNTLTAFLQKPTILLYGESAYKPMVLIDEIRQNLPIYRVSHTHNILLQTVLENGLPALILLLYVGFDFCRRSYRLMTGKRMDFWKTVVPIPAIICILADMVDITARANGDLPMMTILYLFMGITVACCPKNPKQTGNVSES